MKKILFGIGCIIISLVSFTEYSYAATASFTTRDGRVFCETDSFDGSYRICSKEQATGTGLMSAERYNARLVDTTVGKICVEDGKEADMISCQEEVSTTKPVPIVDQPNTSTGTTSTTVVSGTTNTGMVDNSVPATIVTPTSAVLVPPTTKSPPADEAIVTGTPDNGVIQSIKTSYRVCIEGTGNITCINALLKIKDALMDMSTLSLVGIIIVLLISIIFWFKMLVHAVGHPVSGKIIWIVVILLLSLPGAILYYFIALRPYEAMILASLPPRPPSFFN